MIIRYLGRNVATSWWDGVGRELEGGDPPVSFDPQRLGGAGRHGALDVVAVALGDLVAEDHEISVTAGCPVRTAPSR